MGATVISSTAKEQHAASKLGALFRGHNTRKLLRREGSLKFIDAERKTKITRRASKLKLDAATGLEKRTATATDDLSLVQSRGVADAVSSFMGVEPSDVAVSLRPGAAYNEDTDQVWPM